MLNENKQIPKVPNLPEYQRDSMDEFFEDVKFLTSFIGCNIFEIIKTKEQDRKSTRLNSSHNRESRMPSSA